LAAQANKDVVNRFYDAVNTALVSGDTAYLAGMLPADFVDHEPVSGLTPDRAGLLQYVTTRKVVTVERLTVTADAAWRWMDFSGERLLYVESGTITVFVEASSSVPAQRSQATAGEEPRLQTQVEPGTEAVLTSGQLLALSSGTTVTTRTLDGTVAVVWVVTMTHSSSNSVATGGWFSPAPAPVLRVPTEGVTATLPIGLTTVALGRMTLPPGGELPRHEVAGGELLVVETGALSLATTGDAAWVRRGETGGATSEAETTLSAIDAAYVPAGAVDSLRNDGAVPLVVLVVTITPIGARV
jgi:quercetin dioxygenase-like cupin family protein